MRSSLILLSICFIIISTGCNVKKDVDMKSKISDKYNNSIIIVPGLNQEKRDSEGNLIQGVDIYKSDGMLFERIMGKEHYSSIDISADKEEIIGFTEKNNEYEVIKYNSNTKETTSEFKIDRREGHLSKIRLRPNSEQIWFLLSDELFYYDISSKKIVQNPIGDTIDSFMFADNDNKIYYESKNKVFCYDLSEKNSSLYCDLNGGYRFAISPNARYLAYIAPHSDNRLIVEDLQEHKQYSYLSNTDNFWDYCFSQDSNTLAIVRFGAKKGIANGDLVDLFDFKNNRKQTIIPFIWPSGLVDSIAWR